MDDHGANMKTCALQWLVASQHPVLASELYAVMRIVKSPGAEEDIAPEDDEEHLDPIAMGAIEDLKADGFIWFYEDSTNPDNRLYVRFSLPPPDHHEHDSSQRSDNFDFTRAEAHVFAARVCLEICRTTAMQLADFRAENVHLADFIEYAWKYWSVHLFLATKRHPEMSVEEYSNGPRILLDHELKRVVQHVWIEAAKFLVSLNGRLIRLGQDPGSTDRSCLELTKRALGSLEFPLDWLSSMVRGGTDCSCFSAADILCDAWRESKEFHRDTPAQPLGDLASAASLDEATPGYFEPDKLLKRVHSLPFLGDREKPLMEGLVNTVQGLRSLCIPIAQNPLLEELSGGDSGHVSPLDLLLHVADFLEALLSIPLWDGMPNLYLEKSMETIDPHLVLRSDLFWEEWNGIQYAFSHQDDVDSRLRVHVVAGSPDTSLPLSTICNFILNSKKLCRIEVDNNRHLGLAGEPQLQEGQSHPLSTLLGHLHTGTSPGYVEFTEDTTERYLKLKSVVLTYGYRIAFAQIIAAIVMNHNRAIFFPWLGVDIWQSPMEQLRLARSNPEIFLVEFHSCTWFDIFFCIMQRVACELIASLALKFTIADSTRRETGREPDPRRLISGIVYLAWVFMTVEYLFSRCVNSWAVISAIETLGSSDSISAHIALKIFATKHWSKFLFMLGQLCYFLWTTVFPILRDNFWFALTGQLGPTLFFSFISVMTKAVITYRSFFFILLEISNMFVAAGWAVVGFWVLCAGFVDDSVGVKLTAALARFRGERARKQIERGEMETAGLMRQWAEEFSGHLSVLQWAQTEFGDMVEKDLVRGGGIME